MERGEIWWADLREPSGSEPGYRRPVLIVQTNWFTNSRIQTVIVIALTSNLRFAEMPGNVFVTARHTGLLRDSVINISQIITTDKTSLTERVGQIDDEIMVQVEHGIRSILDL